MKLSTKKFLSLWFIPPEGIESKLSKQQQQLIDFHIRMSSSSSSSGLKKKRLPTFIPHVTLIGGIPISDCCTVEDDVLPLLQQSQQQQQRIAKITWSDDQADEVAAKSVVMRLANAFCHFGGVECNFVKERGVFGRKRMEEAGAVITNNNDLDYNNNSSSGDGDGDTSNNNSGYNEEEGGEFQWNQSCISIMAHTDKDPFTTAVELADRVLHLKPPTCEPHYSFVYGNDASLISSLQPPPSSSSSSSNSSSDDVSSSGGGIMKKNDDLVLQCPPNFTSTEIAVMWTYPSTLEGVEQWREIGRFSLVEEEGVRSSGPRGNGSKRVRDGQGLSDREARPCARSRSATSEQGGGSTLPNKSDSIAARHDGLVYACCI